MRFDGIIKTWNDERGFGFITPLQGEQEIFVHIKGFSSRGVRPQVGQAVSFEVELNPEGKKRAKAVEPLRWGVPLRKRRPQTRPVQFDTASAIVLSVFPIFYVLAAFVWEVPVWVAAFYVVTSIVAFIIYAMDKSAAAAGTWRVSESMLLLIGLFGGWPGAIIAQQVLRHKSSKASFRSTFWGTVVVNIAVFIVFASPLAKLLLKVLSAP